MTLLSQMEKNQVTGKEITRQSALLGRRLPSSWISRITSGTQSWVSHKNLETLARCVSAAPSDHAELVKAHLLDERPAFAAKLVSVTTVKDAKEITADAATLSQTNPATRAAINFLIGKPESHHLLISLAAALGMNK